MPGPLKDSELSNWTTQIRKGLLDYCVLKRLGRGERYGYQLVRELEQLPNLVITEGTIYPILAKLKRDRFVETELKDTGSGPARRYYRLTSAGKRTSESMSAYWGELIHSIGKL